MNNSFPHLTKLLTVISLFYAIAYPIRAQVSYSANPVLQVGHTTFSRTEAIDISPDGRLVVTGDSYGTLKFWDASLKKQRLTVKAHRGSVNVIKFSPDGAQLLTGGEDAVLILWDAKTGRAIKFFTDHSSPIRCIAFSPDGKIAVSAGGTYGEAEGLTDNVLRVWDVRDMKPLNILRGHTQTLVTLAFNSSGTQIASGSRDNTVRIWSPTGTGEIVKLPTEAVDSVSFSPDGSTLATAKPKAVLFWDVETGEFKSTLQHDGYSGNVWFSSDWHLMFVDHSNTKVWDVLKKVPLRSLGNDGEISAITPNGNNLATEGLEPLAIWDTERNQPVVDFGKQATSPSPTTGVTFSRSGKLAAWIGAPVGQITDAQQSGDGLYVFDMENLILRHAFSTNQSIHEIAISPDEHTLISCGDDGSTIYTISPPKLIAMRGAEQAESMTCSTVSFKSDGRQAAFAGRIFPRKPGSLAPDFERGYLGVQIVDTKSWRTIKTMKLPATKDKYPKGGITSIAFSPDGKLLATTDDFLGLVIWEIQTGTAVRIRDNRREPMISVAFDQLGNRIATGGFDRTIKLWDVKSRVLSKSISGAQGPVSSVRFSQNDEDIISGSYDESVRITNIRSGESTFLYGHTGPINFVSVSPDGKLILSSGLDGLVNIWSIPSRTIVSTIYVDGADGGVNFTPDGLYYVIGKGGSDILAWTAGDRLLVNRAETEFFNRPDIVRSRIRGSPPMLSASTMRANISRTEGVAWSEYDKMLRNEWRGHKYYALIIGNDRYRNPWTVLPNSVRDARDVRTVLAQRLNFDTGEPLYNVTKAEILKALRTIAEKAGDDSSFLLYYSGHGYYDDATDKAFWIPVDGTRNRATWISSDEVFASLNAIKSRHILVIADSCFAGAFDKGSKLEVFDEPPTLMLSKMKQRSRTLITSGGNEPVSGAGKNHSIFAEYVIEGLQKLPRNVFSADKFFYEFLYTDTVLRQITPSLRDIGRTIVPRPSLSEAGDRFYFMRNEP